MLFDAITILIIDRPMEYPSTHGKYIYPYLKWARTF